MLTDSLRVYNLWNFGPSCCTIKQITGEKWCTASSKFWSSHCFFLSDHTFLSVLQVQPNSYCTFYDDQRQNWSMMFESEKASLDFCKEVSDTGEDLVCDKSNTEYTPLSFWPTYRMCYLVYKMVTSFLWFSSGMFGESKQRSLVRCCGGSGSGSRWGPGGGERRLSGGGVHRMAPAEPHHRTGHTHLPLLFIQFPHIVASSCGFSTLDGTQVTESSISFQMFDSNQNKDKLLRLKVGAGKVMKVSPNTLYQMRIAVRSHTFFRWSL